MSKTKEPKCAACRESEAAIFYPVREHVTDTGSANQGVVKTPCPISGEEYDRLFGIEHIDD